MKRIVASVGLVALGVAGVQNASGQSLSSPESPKPWSVSATLRGFYDDNVNTAPSGSAKQDSFGFEVSPQAALGWSLEQTTISLAYIYSLKFYDKRPNTATDRYDQSHTFNLALSHAFNERYRAQVSDSFVIGQEPDILRTGNAMTTFQRISGDNIRNYGKIGFEGQFTPRFGVSLGYDNAYFNYADHGETLGFSGTTTNITPSLSGLLDRIEHGIHAEGLFTLQPQTRLLLGYRFRDIGYTGDEYISGIVTSTDVVDPVRSDNRNARQHAVYTGVQHGFAPNLTGGLKIGASYFDYYNDPNQAVGSWSPYVNLSLRYTYAMESYIEAGFDYDRNATDIVAANPIGGKVNYTIDQDTAVVYATVNHRFTPHIFGSLVGQFQNSIYNDGYVNGNNDQFYLIGVNLEYRFNKNLSAHIGYNFDHLESGINIAGVQRSFDRNRVYIGITAGL